MPEMKTARLIGGSRTARLQRRLVPARPGRERVADDVEVARLAHHLAIARHRAHPLAHARVRLLRQVERRQPEERRPVHARRRHAHLSEPAVGRAQVLDRDLAVRPAGPIAYLDRYGTKALRVGPNTSAVTVYGV